MAPTARTSSSSTMASQRIYSLSTDAESRETLTTNTATAAVFRRPTQSNAYAERIRILLAPYMSPYVVPVHKVRTWDRLNRTLLDLFGSEAFSGSSVRITDYKGRTIIPASWSEMLVANMTIIVDTSSYIPENSPVIFESKQYKKEEEEGNESDDTYVSATALVLAERESEDSAYESAHPISPLGQIGQTALLAPPGSLKTRPVKEAWEGWAADAGPDKRSTSVSMFTGKHHLEDASTKPSIPSVPATAPLAPPVAEEKPFKRQEKSPMGHSNFVAAGEEMEKGRLAKPTKREQKTTWAKVTKALRFLLSTGGSVKDNGRANGKTQQHSPTRVPSHRRAVTESTPFTFPRPPPASQSEEHRLYRNSSRRKTSISKRRGVPTLPPVDLGSNPFDFALPAPQQQQRRSKSLSGVPDRPAAIQKRSNSIFTSEKRPEYRHSRSQSTMDSRKSRQSRTSMLSRGLSLRRKKSVIDISPPIPRRPAEELGINAQYKTPGLDRSQLEEMVGADALDGSTLASSSEGSRSRRGTGDSDGPQPRANKPLPKLPHKFSMFPPPSPPRTPLDLVTRRQDAESRPTTASSMVKKGSIVTLKRVASAGVLEIKPGPRSGKRRPDGFI